MHGNVREVVQQKYDEPLVMGGGYHGNSLLSQSHSRRAFNENPTDRENGFRVVRVSRQRL